MPEISDSLLLCVVITYSVLFFLIFVLKVPVYKEPSFTIPGHPAIIKHEILNNRRHVLTKVQGSTIFIFCT